MKHPVRHPALAAVAVVAVVVVSALLLTPFARSQIQATPSYLPMGVASAGNTSMAWFHEPSSGRVLACQSGGTGGSLSTIQCVTAKLP